MWDIGLPERDASVLPAFVRDMAADGRGKLAVFDADGTLWRDDVADDFTTWMRTAQGMASDAQWAEYLAIYRDDHAAGCRFLLRLYAGLERSELHAHVFEWWRQHSWRRYIPEAIEALRTLAERGYTIWVVTGSPMDTMLPLKEFLPVDEVVGMDFADDQGRLTGELAGISCADEGKAEKVLSLWPNSPETIVFGAGNGSLDAAMLHLAREVVWAVYPNPSFQTYAEAQGWPVLARPADFVEEAKLA